MGFLERLRDWWKKRHPKPPVPTSPFLYRDEICLRESIADDYYLQMLIQGEINAIKPNLQLLRGIFKEVYPRLGGNFGNLKMIVQIIGSKWIDKRLSQTDLPGPDALIRPQVEQLSKQFIGDAFDDFFAPGGS